MRAERERRARGEAKKEKENGKNDNVFFYSLSFVRPLFFSSTSSSCLPRKEFAVPAAFAFSCFLFFYIGSRSSLSFFFLRPSFSLLPPLLPPNFRQLKLPRPDPPLLFFRLSLSASR